MIIEIDEEKCDDLVIDVYTKDGKEFIGCDFVTDGTTNLEIIVFWSEGALTTIPIDNIKMLVTRDRNYKNIQKENEDV